MDHGVNVSNLLQERSKLRKALSALDDLLRSLDVDLGALDGTHRSARITLSAAIKTVCAQMRENITKAGILEALRQSYPQLNPNAQSVAAALVKLTRGGKPYLYVEKRGAGNQPSVYTTKETQILKLTPKQMKLLFAPERTHGSGGWQSLFKRLQNATDPDRSEIILTERLEIDMENYFVRYGQGGWQNALKQIFEGHQLYMFMCDTDK
jgi:hypothetical protein